MALAEERRSNFDPTVAQKRRMTAPPSQRKREKRPPKPLDEQALHAAGVSEADRVPLRDAGREQATSSALAFARRKRIGPFAQESADPDRRRKQLQAFIRAGHDFALARALVFADSMEEIAGLDEDFGRE